MRPSPLALRHACALLSTALLAALLVTAGAPPAARDMAPAAGSTYLCSGYAGCRGEGYSDAGYGSVSHKMYWNMYSGHNCTNYVAYRMIKAGMSTKRPFGYPGNASHWGKHRSDITDQRPSVGAVAWWGAYDNGSGSAGHVAYVERVQDNGRTIVISEDSWGGTFHWRRITKSSGRWPTGFIHFIDRTVENTARPKINGTARLGQSLQVNTGGWTPKPNKTLVAWFADGKQVRGWSANKSLQLGPAHVGKRIQARVKAKKWPYESGRKWTWRTGEVKPGALSVTRKPAIQGTPVAGDELTANVGAYSAKPDSVSVQWLADGKPLPGETGRTLALTKQHAGARISVKVSVSKAGYNGQTVTSEQTEWVRKGYLRVAESGKVNGWPKVGNQLRAAPGTARPDWRVEASYQWLRDGSPIDGATDRRYRLAPADHLRDIAVRISYAHPQRYGVSEVVKVDAKVRTRPAMKVRTKVKGQRRDKVVVNAYLSTDVSASLDGKVSVWFAGRGQSVRVENGHARLVFRRVDPGKHQAKVMYHQNWKFYRVVAKQQFRVPWNR
ncbi:CHAP domain-containing protein [Nocardioides panacisoli]|uniref:CHAP domain-containing protein n=1 Tax=Nocardioides panacisoli TaxID=627624 RepID=UPI001C6255DE|nr:CHAP domain-containing protein [Nocardioides panacisoli]QYJ04331.1 CHAP domain-containing protein [Nocardioides panacisoli]